MSTSLRRSVFAACQAEVPLLIQVLLHLAEFLGDLADHLRQVLDPTMAAGTSKPGPKPVDFVSQDAHRRWADCFGK